MATFLKWNFTKFVSRYVKILGRWLTQFEGCSLARTGSINLSSFHTFVCKFGRVEGAAREKKYRQMYEKLENSTERLFSNIYSLNLVNTIFYLVF